MSQKSKKLARKVAVRFGFPEKAMKDGGIGLSSKMKGSAYRKMRAALRMPHRTNLDQLTDELTKAND